MHGLSHWNLLPVQNDRRKLENADRNSEKYGILDTKGLTVMSGHLQVSAVETQISGFRTAENIEQQLITYTLFSTRGA